MLGAVDVDRQHTEIMRTQMVYDANRKSVGAAYLLWFFLGGFGAHRFYLGHIVSGAIQLVLFVLGWMTVWIVIGAVPLTVVGIWWLVDAFLIPGMARGHNLELAGALTGDGPPRKDGFGPARVAR
jgi:TM2 domain-containing membrane protein YozV